jgi:hypothetical protein
MSLIDLLPRSVTRLTRLAVVFALLGLFAFAIGIFVPKPLPVIFSMSIGHGFGMVAVLLYFAAIVIDLTRRDSPARNSVPAPNVADPTSTHPE